MNFKLPQFDFLLLGVIAGAVVIKVATSQKLTVRGGILTAFMSIFAPVVFTKPICFYAGIEEEFMKYAVAALLTLTGEGLMRFVMGLSGDRGLLNSIVERFLERYIGKGKK